MLLGLILRSGTFAFNAGLILLLAQQAPPLDWRNMSAKSGMLEEYRNTVFAGLVRVRADLETNGKLLFPARQATGTRPDQ